MSTGREAPRIAVVPVRDAALPAGADETIAEAGGVVLLAGSGTGEAAASLTADAVSVATAEIGNPVFGAWAAALAPVLAPYHAVLLPASPGGRDLAPRLAAAMDRPLLAGATEYRDGEVRLARCGGLVMEQVAADGPVVVTLQPGVRGIEPRQRQLPAPEPVTARVVAGHDATVLDVLPPDPGTMDLAESRRIMAGGAGLRGPADFRLLNEVATAIGASVGATRVVADMGWVAHERYIGTTGGPRWSPDTEEIGWITEPPAAAERGRLSGKDGPVSTDYLPSRPALAHAALWPVGPLHQRDCQA